MAMGEVHEIDQIVDFLSKEYRNELHLYRSKSTYLEISPKSISKLTAIKFLLDQHFNFALEDVIAYGDNYNDVEMLNHVGFGVAVGNAREEAKLVAKHITALSIEDGVALSLQQLGPLKNW
jgi:hydroxymethylpyrimidine pyrophosphatase-like HAD family hydrolase